MTKALAIAGITQFQGLLSNSDAQDAPAGSAQIQRNLQCIMPGRMDVRGGMLPTAFANEQADTAYNIIFMYSAQRAEADYVVYQTSDGVVHAGRNPT